MPTAHAWVAQPDPGITRCAATHCGKLVTSCDIHHTSTVPYAASSWPLTSLHSPATSSNPASRPTASDVVPAQASGGAQGHSQLHPACFVAATAAAGAPAGPAARSCSPSTTGCRPLLDAAPVARHPIVTQALHVRGASTTGMIIQHCIHFEVQVRCCR
jgi:hypothetical protein